MTYWNCPFSPIRFFEGTSCIYPSKTIFCIDIVQLRGQQLAVALDVAILNIFAHIIFEVCKNRMYAHFHSKALM